MISVSLKNSPLVSQWVGNGFRGRSRAGVGEQEGQLVEDDGGGVQPCRDHDHAVELEMN